MYSKEQWRAYYRAHRKSYLAASNKWRAAHREQYNRNQRLWRAKNPKYQKELAKKYRAKRNQLGKTAQYYRRHRQKPEILLQHRIRERIRSALVRKTCATISLLGCNYLEYKQYIENHFLPGMSWENKNLWHIDHVRPISNFNLSDPLELSAAFHYSNTQPLWAKQNLQKGSHYG